MRPNVVTLVGTALLAAALAGAGGCTQTFAWFVAAFPQPKKIDAVYKPPKDKKILVLVEDKPFPVSYEPLKRELAERVSRKLQDEKIARATVSYDRVQDLSTTREYDQLPIAVVGQKLGADLVLYVQIEAFRLKDNPYSPMWQGQLATSVWVVDTHKPEKLWPKDTIGGTGYRVPPLELRSLEDPSPTYGEEVVKMLADQMADRIVKLFYDHEEQADPHHDTGPRQPD